MCLFDFSIWSGCGQEKQCWEYFLLRGWGEYKHQLRLLHRFDETPVGHCSIIIALYQTGADGCQRCRQWKTIQFRQRLATWSQFCMPSQTVQQWRSASVHHTATEPGVHSHNNAFGGSKNCTQYHLGRHRLVQQSDCELRTIPHNVFVLRCTRKDDERQWFWGHRCQIRALCQWIHRSGDVWQTLQPVSACSSANIGCPWKTVADVISQHNWDKFWHRQLTWSLYSGIWAVISESGTSWSKWERQELFDWMREIQGGSTSGAIWQNRTILAAILWPCVDSTAGLLGLGLGLGREAKFSGLGLETSGLGLVFLALALFKVKVKVTNILPNSV